MTHTEIMLLILAAGVFIYFVWRKMSGSKRKIESPKAGPKRSCCG